MYIHFSATMGQSSYLLCLCSCVCVTKKLKKINHHIENHSTADIIYHQSHKQQRKKKQNHKHCSYQFPAFIGSSHFTIPELFQQEKSFLVATLRLEARKHSKNYLLLLNLITAVQQPSLRLQWQPTAKFGLWNSSMALLPQVQRRKKILSDPCKLTRNPLLCCSSFTKIQYWVHGSVHSPKGDLANLCLKPFWNSTGLNTALSN